MKARVLNRKPVNDIGVTDEYTIPPVAFAILQENGDYILTEDNNIFEQEH